MFRWVVLLFVKFFLAIFFFINIEEDIIAMDTSICIETQRKTSRFEKMSAFG